ncbi:hypothetical protein [Ruficoccus sp. ZRK36]|uniref:hypothetical protein n=1 Tax=Ruficoccus sp. ZRK36 TaxID=2866311 RepID=UPI001C72DE86|nr:hypothetical protein [Ruficoccus sp. ZRK36]QYY34614.1 hypothetical protein K0V07_09895 [Ruficoccus sp. ZRK36]
MTEEIQEGNLRFNRASRPESGKYVWRCIHDGQRVLNVFETNGETDSIHEMADFDTPEELKAGIEALGLENPVEDYDPEQAARLERQRRRAGIQQDLDHE